MLDGGFFYFRKSPQTFTTKKTTIFQFVDLYAGPVYNMHFKYSSILVQVAVSFMYGMALPVLFPITLLGIINMYITERFMLAYWYRQPPRYDAEINNTAIGYLRTFPVLMFLMGYW